MKNILSILFFLTTPFAFCQDSLAYDREEVEALLLEGLALRLDKWFAGDGGGYLDGFSEEFTYWDPLLEGKRFESIQSLRDEFNNRKTDFEHFGVEVPVFQHSKDQIVLTCNVRHKFFGGFDLTWSATEVFQLIDGEWKIIHAHWSAFGPGLFQFPTIFLVVGIFLLICIAFVMGRWFGMRKGKLAKEPIQK